MWRLLESSLEFDQKFKCGYSVVELSDKRSGLKRFRLYVEESYSKVPILGVTALDSCLPEYSNFELQSRKLRSSAHIQLSALASIFIYKS